MIYAGTEFLTGDRIAAALMRYSGALAEAGQAETIAVPAVGDDGSVVEVMVLIGPASQIVAQDADTDHPELVDEAVIGELDAKAGRLTPTAVVETEPAFGADWDGASSTDDI